MHSLVRGVIKFGQEVNVPILAIFMDPLFFWTCPPAIVEEQ